MKMLTRYERTMTRDAPIIMIEAWDECFRRISAFFKIKWPDPVFVFQDGTVTSYRATKLFYERLPLQISAWAKTPANAKRLTAQFDIYTTCAEKMRRKKVKDLAVPDAFHEIKGIVDLLVQGCIGLIPAFWSVTWNDKAIAHHQKPLFSAALLEKARLIREGDALFDDGVDLVYGYLDMIAEKNKWPKEFMKFLCLDELDAAIQSRKRPDFTQARKRAEGYGYFGKQLFLKADAAAAFEQHGYLLVEPEAKPTGLLHGAIASKGVARGRVVVIVNREQLGKMRNGDILIAPMTTPWYVPAMEKAAAFVTDEGGIMCHAAIIAREMKKPCVIGTKIATKVFKDGDVAEVDADKGIVKVIAHAKR